MNEHFRVHVTQMIRNKIGSWRSGDQFSLLQLDKLYLSDILGKYYHVRLQAVSLLLENPWGKTQRRTQHSSVRASVIGEAASRQ